MQNDKRIEIREKQLYKNTGIIAVGTLCSKAFQFLLLPLYTNALSTNDYGTIDLLTTIASLIIPIITIQISSSVFRFIIDKDDELERAQIISTGFGVELCSTIISVIAIMFVNSIIPINYCRWFIIFIVTGVWSDFVQNTVRGLGNNVIYSILSFLLTIISVVLNVVFIMIFHLNGKSILIAASIAYLVAPLWAFYQLKLHRYIRKEAFSRRVLKLLLQYCLPLIPNAISWWIANTSDRVLITMYLGTSINGIYAAANKIPALYTTMFNVFNLAWTETVSRGADDSCQEEFVNIMFERCIRIFGCICLGIIAGMGIFFNMLIGERYAEAYDHIWILTVAIFFNSLCSLFGGVFSAFKKSKIIGKSTIWGAIVNLVINIATINYLGLYAASLSTLFSYIVILLIRNYYSKKLMKIRWPRKVIVQFMVAFLLVTIIYFVGNVLWKCSCLIILVIWSVYINKNFLVILLEKFLKRKIRKVEED